MTVLFFLSCMGYGSGLSRLCGLGRRHWGERAVLGIGTLICAGGFLAVSGLVSTGANFLVLGAGALLAFPLVRDAIRRLASIRLLRGTKTELIGLSPVVVLRLASIVLLSSAAVGSLVPFWLDGCDDLVSYFYFPRAMLETGELIEPFNMRRMAQLGGQIYLQTLLFPSLNISAVSFLDVGIGMILVWGLTRGFVREFSGGDRHSLLKEEAFALFSLGIAYSMLFYNHGPRHLPFALSLAMIQYMFRLHRQNAISLRDLMPLVVIVCATLTLRNNMIIFIGLLALSFLFINMRKMGSGAMLIKVSAICILVACSYLIPWMFLSFKSSGTFFFPLMKGNYAFPLGLSVPMGPAGKVAFVMDNVLSSRVLVLFGLALTGIFLRKFPLFIGVLGLSVLMTIILMSLALTAANTYSIYRYYQSMLFPSLIVAFVILFLPDAGTTKSGNRAAGLAFKAVAVALVVWWALFPVTLKFGAPDDVREYEHSRFGLALEHLGGFASRAGELYDTDIRTYWKQGDAVSYENVQRILPEKSKVLSATAKPYYWDLERHEVHTLDTVGQASPPPGMPFFEGAEAMRKYLSGLGYRYLVFTPPESDNCLYNRERWIYAQRGDSFIWRNWARYFLDFFDNQKRLERRGALVYSDAYLKVVDLQVTR